MRLRDDYQFDRDRVFYPMLAAVTATYYGFRKGLWLIVLALAGHGVFDLSHHLFVSNPGLPQWWPGFCLSCDVPAAGFLALLLMRRSGFASKL